MDKLRTNWIIIILILFFAVFILSYLFSTYQKETFSINGTYIDGKYTLKNAPELRHTSNKKALDAGYIKSESNCGLLCLNQVECLDKNTNCKSTYEPSTKDCYCQFKKVVEGFDIFDDILNLPNEVKPTWEAEYFRKKWNPLKRQSLGKWKDLGIKQRNNMSISFWIYFNEHMMLKNPNMKWVSLFQVTSTDFTQVSSFDWQKSGNDRYLGIWNVEQTARLYICGKTSSNKSEGDNKLPNYIGFNRDEPSFVVITYINNKCVFYRDGEEIASFTAQMAYLEPEPEYQLFSGYPFHDVGMEPQGISLKDLKVYNGAIRAETVKTLYKELNTDNKGVGWQNATAEGFQMREGFESEGPNDDQEGPNDDQGSSGMTENYGYQGANEASTYISDSGINTKLDQPNMVEISTMEMSGSRFPDNFQFLTSPEKKTCKVDFESRRISNGQGNPRKGNLAFNSATYESYNHSNTLKPPFNENNVQTEIVKYLENPNLAPDNGKRIDGKLTITSIHPYDSNNWRYWTIKKGQSRKKLRDGLNEIAPLLRSFNLDNYNPNDVCNSAAPICSNYIYNQRPGQCSAKSNPVTKTEQINVVDMDNKSIVKKTMSVIRFDNTKEEFLEMTTKFIPVDMGFSICFWVKILNRHIENPIKIFAFYNKIGRNNSDTIAITVSTKNVLHFKINDTAYESRIKDIADETWQHVAWTVSKTGEWSVYHNGYGYASNPVKGIYPSINPRKNQVIGGPNDAIDAFLDGYIGDIRFYNGVLSPDEVWTVRNTPR
jgi:hypothetical protein